MNIAKIKHVDTNKAAVVFDDGDELGFWAPINGGYVKDHHGQQWCDGFSKRGPTLLWFPESGTLADYLRKERRRAQKKKTGF